MYKNYRGRALLIDFMVQAVLAQFGGLIAVSAIGIGLSMAKFNIIVLLINSIMLMAYIVFLEVRKHKVKYLFVEILKGI